MNKRLISNGFVDLTPLLDVVLILLFALLMNMTMEQEATEKIAEDTASELASTSADLVQIEEKNETLSRLVEQMNFQQEELSEALIQWFVEEGILEGDLGEVEHEQLMELLDPEKASKSLYQMDYISSKFFFVDVKVDALNQYRVIINGDITTIQLNQEAFYDDEAKISIETDFYNALERVLSQKEGGYQYVLLTVTDDGSMFKYGFDLIWKVFGQIESKHGTDQVHKMQYITY